MKRELLILKSLIMMGITGIFVIGVIYLPYQGLTQITDFDLWDLLFLVMVYGTLIPLAYVGYQSILILNSISQHEFFNHQTSQRFKNISFSALFVSGLYLLSMPALIYMAELDDAPGLAAIGLLIMVFSFAVYLACSIFKKIINEKIMKS